MKEYKFGCVQINQTNSNFVEFLNKVPIFLFEILYKSHRCVASFEMIVVTIQDFNQIYHLSHD